MGPNTFSAFGLYDDGDPSAPGGVGFAEATSTSGNGTAEVHDDQRASDLASPTTGQFLVRPAPLLQIHLNTPGDVLVTRDTDTGLDWLDLTESTNLSFDQVEADMGGFISDGWRHATGAEVCALFASVTAEPSPCPGNFVVAFGAATPFFLLGRTFTGFNEFSARGFYDDGDRFSPGGWGLPKPPFSSACRGRRRTTISVHRI